MTKLEEAAQKYNLGSIAAASAFASIPAGQRIIAAADRADRERQEVERILANDREMFGMTEEQQAALIGTGNYQGALSVILKYKPPLRFGVDIDVKRPLRRGR